MSDLHPILVAGAWRAAENPSATITAASPATGETLPGTYPISSQADVDAALAAASEAAPALRATDPETIAAFLERYADGLEANREALVAAASASSGFPAEPRLNSVELPRTYGQLRQAAKAVRERSWTQPVLDTQAGIRSLYEPLGGAALIFGPNNFPFAFNAVAGGDFAAAIAARCPVIAIAHPLHPETSRLLAETAYEAAIETGLPAGAVQMLYGVAPEIGLKMVESCSIAAVGFTGSRRAGLKLKEAADRLGKPAFCEMSSVNPVFFFEGALTERGDALAGEFFSSCTMGAGQFCTNPGLVIVPSGSTGDSFVGAATEKFAAGAPGLLLSEGGRDGLAESVKALINAGASVLCGGKIGPEPGFRFQPTLLTVSGADFLKAPDALQTEAFGPVSLIVRPESDDEAVAIAASLEGNLTGTIYSATESGADDALYARLAPVLRTKVGRLLNDKMPTGVAVSPAMNHGGPFPATGHPHFSSVGIPQSISRFAMLCSYDNVKGSRLPAELQDGNPLGIGRMVDGAWTKE